MSSIGFLELLALRGFDRNSRFKLVRHQDRRCDIQSLIREGWFETYQSFQSRPVFDSCDFIVSFTGAEGSRAKLHGIYKVGQRRKSEAVSFPLHCPYTEWHTAGFHYELTPVSGFEDLCGRVVIEWGKGTLAWVQNGRDKPLHAILPPGRALPLFSDYLDFSLTFQELRLLQTDLDANSDWRARLSAVAGVYLIVATTTGQQYVGSASGAEGIWGRWSCYARDGHAGNVLLRNLVESGTGYPEAFAYSLLQIVPRSYSRHEVFRLEKRYKDKLGKRATDLNGN
jgi:hypothetical protein